MVVNGAARRHIPARSRSEKENAPRAAGRPAGAALLLRVLAPKIQSHESNDSICSISTRPDIPRSTIPDSYQNRNGRTYAGPWSASQMPSRQSSGRAAPRPTGGASATKLCCPAPPRANDSFARHVSMVGKMILNEINGTLTYIDLRARGAGSVCMSTPRRSRRARAKPEPGPRARAKRQSQGRGRAQRARARAAGAREEPEPGPRARAGA